MFRKNGFAVVALALALAGASGRAQAGASDPYEVYIHETGFHGSTAAARFSSDDTQLIQCTLIAYAGPRDFVLCVARDRSGKYNSCWSERWTHREVVKAMGDFAGLHVLVNEDGTCQSIQIYKSSVDLPELGVNR